MLQENVLVSFLRKFDEHLFNVVITCTDQGYTIYTCTRDGCDYSEKADYTDYNPTEEQVYNDIIALKEIYREGDTWSEGDEYYRTWSGGLFGGADACMGFAIMLSEEAFGYLPARKHTDFSNIKVRDIVSLYNNGHAAIVIEVTEDGGVYTAEGNVGAGTITWKSGYSYLDVEQYFNYVITRYPE